MTDEIAAQTIESLKYERQGYERRQLAAEEELKTASTDEDKAKANKELATAKRRQGEVDAEIARLQNPPKSPRTKKADE